MKKIIELAISSIGSLGSFVANRSPYVVPASTPDAWHSDWSKIGLDLHTVINRDSRELPVAQRGCTP